MGLILQKRVSPNLFVLPKVCQTPTILDIYLNDQYEVDKKCKFCKFISILYLVGKNKTTTTCHCFLNVFLEERRIM